MPTFAETVLYGAGALALKQGVTHLLTVRERILEGNMATGKPSSVAFKEDTTIHPAVMMLFKTLTLSVGPQIASVDRFVATVRNNNENEPYFLALAVAYVASGVAAPAWAATAVKTYVAGRYAHNVFYLFGVQQPFRAFAYLPALFSMIFLAASIFL